MASAVVDTDVVSYVFRGDTRAALYRPHPFDPDLCERWAHVTVMARRLGRPIQHADAWIAATALLHNVPLITHNRDDYAGVPGLVVVSARTP